MLTKSFPQQGQDEPFPEVFFQLSDGYPNNGIRYPLKNNLISKNKWGKLDDLNLLRNRRIRMNKK